MNGEQPRVACERRIRRRQVSEARNENDVEGDVECGRGRAGKGHADRLLLVLLDVDVHRVGELEDAAERHRRDRVHRRHVGLPSEHKQNLGGGKADEQREDGKERHVWLARPPDALIVPLVQPVPKPRREGAVQRGDEDRHDEADVVGEAVERVGLRTAHLGDEDPIDRPQKGHGEQVWDERPRDPEGVAPVRDVDAPDLSREPHEDDGADEDGGEHAPEHDAVEGVGQQVGEGDGERGDPDREDDADEHGPLVAEPEPLPRLERGGDREEDEVQGHGEQVLRGHGEQTGEKGRRGLHNKQPDDSGREPQHHYAERVLVEPVSEVLARADDRGLETERHDDVHDGEQRQEVVVLAVLRLCEHAGEQRDGEEIDALHQEVCTGIPDRRRDCFTFQFYTNSKFSSLFASNSLFFPDLAELA